MHEKTTNGLDSRILLTFLCFLDNMFEVLLNYFYKFMKDLSVILFLVFPQSKAQLPQILFLLKMYF